MYVPMIDNHSLQENKQVSSGNRKLQIKTTMCYHHMAEMKRLVTIWSNYNSQMSLVGVSSVLSRQRFGSLL